MFESIKHRWQTFRNAPAGTRFERQYHRRSTRSGAARKILVSLIGIAFILAGIAMLVLPGPGLLAIVVGAVLVAEESLVVARWFDRVDLALRRWLDRRRQRRA